MTSDDPHKTLLSTSEDREMLAELSNRVGSYIETDERPRPVALWTAMAEAQMAAAIYLNETETADVLGDDSHRAAMRQAATIIINSYQGEPRNDGSTP
jgi:hypothetical protein